MESVDQVMDSMLVKHLIVPVMNDTSDKQRSSDHVSIKNIPGDINREDHYNCIFQ